MSRSLLYVYLLLHVESTGFQPFDDLRFNIRYVYCIASTVSATFQRGFLLQCYFLIVQRGVCRELAAAASIRSQLHSRHMSFSFCFCHVDFVWGFIRWSSSRLLKIWCLHANDISYFDCFISSLIAFLICFWLLPSRFIDISRVGIFLR